MEERTYHPIAVVDHRERPREPATIPHSWSSNSTHPQISHGVIRSVRAHPPGSYMITIRPFSQLSHVMSAPPTRDTYSSNFFDAAGYKWQLHLYPQGDRRRNAEDYVSLYLAIVNVGNKPMPMGWEVNVNFKMFVHDKIRDNYLTIQDANGGFVRFHHQNLMHGFSHLISQAAFHNASNGYILDDLCTFGVEIFAIESPVSKGEKCLSKLYLGIPNVYEWSIREFSKIEDNVIRSPVFTIGQRQWQLELYPNGIDGRKRRLSLYLTLVIAAPSTPYARLKGWLQSFYTREASNLEDGVYFRGSLRIKNPESGEEWSKTFSMLFDAEECTYGYKEFMRLEDLRDNGSAVHDKLIVNASFETLLDKAEI